MVSAALCTAVHQVHGEEKVVLLRRLAHGTCPQAMDQPCDAEPLLGLPRSISSTTSSLDSPTRPVPPCPATTLPATTRPCGITARSRSPRRHITLLPPLTAEDTLITLGHMDEDAQTASGSETDPDDWDFIRPAGGRGPCETCTLQAEHYCGLCRKWAHPCCCCRCSESDMKVREPSPDMDTVIDVIRTGSGKSTKNYMWRDYGEVFRHVAPCQQIFPVEMGNWRRCTPRNERRMRQILSIYNEFGRMAGALSSVLSHFFTTTAGAQASVPNLSENTMRVAAHFARDLIHWIHEYINTEPTQRSLVLPWHSNTMRGNYMLADLGRPYMLLPEFTRWLNTTPDVVGSYIGSSGPPAQGVRSEARSPTPANGECNRAEEGGAEEEDLLWPTEDEDNDPEELEESPNKQVPTA